MQQHIKFKIHGLLPLRKSRSFGVACRLGKTRLGSQHDRRAGSRVRHASSNHCMRLYRKTPINTATGTRNNSRHWNVPSSSSRCVCDVSLSTSRPDSPCKRRHGASKQSIHRPWRWRRTAWRYPVDLLTKGKMATSKRTCLHTKILLLLRSIHRYTRNDSGYPKKTHGAYL